MKRIYAGRQGTVADTVLGLMSENTVKTHQHRVWEAFPPSLHSVCAAENDKSPHQVCLIAKVHQLFCISLALKNVPTVRHSLPISGTLGDNKHVHGKQEGDEVMRPITDSNQNSSSTIRWCYSDRMLCSLIAA